MIWQLTVTNFYRLWTVDDRLVVILLRFSSFVDNFKYRRLKFFFVGGGGGGGDQVNKKYERYKSLIASIYFLYTLLALIFIYPDGSQTFFYVRHRKLDTEWPSSISTDFLSLFTAS